MVAGNGEGEMLLTPHLTQHTQEDKKRKNLTYSTFSSCSSQFINNKWFYNSTLESRKCWNSFRNVGHPSLTNAAPHSRRTETTNTGSSWHSSHSPLSRTALCTVRPFLMDRCFSCGCIIWKVMGVGDMLSLSWGCKVLAVHYIIELFSLCLLVAVFATGLSEWKQLKSHRWWD